MNCEKCGGNKRNKYGQCSICKLEQQRLHNFTPQGKASAMWRGITYRAGNKNGKCPTYQKIQLLMRRDEFINWAVSELEKWIETRPIKFASLDRIDNLGHYEVKNLQVLDKKANLLKKSYNKNVNAPEGCAWCGKCKEYLDVDKFNKNKNTFNGLDSICKVHNKLECQKYHEKIKQYK